MTAANTPVTLASVIAATEASGPSVTRGAVRREAAPGDAPVYARRPAPPLLSMTLAAWSVAIGGVGLWVCGFILGPIGLLVALIALIKAMLQLRFGQLFVALFGVVASVTAMLTSWTLWGLVLIGASS